MVVSAVVAVTIPLIIAGIWAYMLSNNGFGAITILSVVFAVLFMTFTTMGVCQWFSTRWVELNWLIKIYFALAALSCWVFTLTIALLPSVFSFTSCSATLLTINFLPACYMVYQKTLWNDISLRHMTVEVVKRLSTISTSHGGSESNADLDKILAENLKINNHGLKIRFGIAGVAYFVPLIIYAVVMATNENSELKGLGFVNPVFLLFVDALLLSLQE